MKPNSPATAQFAFALGESVFVDHIGRLATVIGRAEYLDRPAYLARVRRADGCNEERWYDADKVKPARASAADASRRRPAAKSRKSA